MRGTTTMSTSKSQEATKSFENDFCLPLFALWQSHLFIYLNYQYYTYRSRLLKSTTTFESSSANLTASIPVFQIVDYRNSIPS